MLAKILEEIGQADHLVSLVPEDSLDWHPLLPDNGLGSPEPFELSRLLAHLAECLAGFCAVLYALRPDQFAHLLALRKQKLTARCGIQQARERIRIYREHIEQSFLSLVDADLSEVLPTVFVARGEAVLTLLLGNLEHLQNHKFQLYFYLKLLGVGVTSRDLYKFRDAHGT